MRDRVKKLYRAFNWLKVNDSPYILVKYVKPQGNISNSKLVNQNAVKKGNV